MKLFKYKVKYIDDFDDEAEVIQRWGIVCAEEYRHAAGKVQERYGWNIEDMSIELLCGSNVMEIEDIGILEALVDASRK